MKLQDLTEAERLVIEKLRLLKKDKGMRHLPQALAECLGILVKKGKKYNRGNSSYDHNFRFGDIGMLVNSHQPMSRLQSIVSDGNGGYSREVPDDVMEDILHDAANWPLLHICYRIERKQNGGGVCHSGPQKNANS